jgi:hypothetical protein
MPLHLLPQRLEENALLLPDCLRADRGQLRTPCPDDAYPSRQTGVSAGRAERGWFAEGARL